MNVIYLTDYSTDTSKQFDTMLLCNVDNGGRMYIIHSSATFLGVCHKLDVADIAVARCIASDMHEWVLQKTLFIKYMMSGFEISIMHKFDGA